MKRSLSAIVAGCLLGFFANAHAQAPVSPSSSPVANPALHDELMKMRERDQNARTRVPGGDPREMGRVDIANTKRLKEIIATHGWPSVAMVGTDGAEAAWLIAQHADLDPDFQRQVLALIEPLAKTGQVSAKDVAYLYDRTHRPQRYGTQGICISETSWKPFEIEDPDHVDARRKEIGTIPLAEYVAIMNKVCKDAATATAAPAASSASSPQRAMSATIPVSINYLLFQPKSYSAKGAPVPLIVFLHGAGESGSDLNKVKKWGPPAIVESNPDFPFMVVSPQAPEGGGWDIDLLKGMLDDVLAKYNVDRHRVYLTGLSMGGFGAWTLAMRYPQYFAAIAPICGGGSTQLIANLRDVPTWVFHGKKDESVPEMASAMLVDALKAAGGNVKYTVLPEGGHVDSWVYAYDAKNGLFDWFLKQRKP
jgi:poly(3-hydroxybutyrate) depolymerase